ncbi:hypothetical protein IAS59_003564 [Cryptococcus gattii]
MMPTRTVLSSTYVLSALSTFFPRNWEAVKTPNPSSLQIHTTVLNSHPLHTSFPPPPSITLSSLHFLLPPFIPPA